jgi:uncharacterized protein (TIGR00297 family)
MAAVVTLAFAVLARAIRGVSRSGAAAGAVVCFLLYVGAGPGAFFALVTVFVLAWVTTRLGHGHKVRQGTAQKSNGRTASQVLANLGIAAVCAVGYRAGGGPVFRLALAAALAEAAADTVSSELGQAFSDKARLITTWETVLAGTDGGVTLAGTVAGVVAAGVVGAVCAWSQLISWTWAELVVVAGALGMLADSVLGAWLQRRGALNNDGVNLLSTVVAAMAITVFNALIP